MSRDDEPHGIPPPRMGACGRRRRTLRRHRFVRARGVHVRRQPLPPSRQEGEPDRRRPPTLGGVSRETPEPPRGGFQRRAAGSTDERVPRNARPSHERHPLEARPWPLVWPRGCGGMRHWKRHRDNRCRDHSAVSRETRSGRSGADGARQEASGHSEQTARPTDGRRQRRPTPPAPGPGAVKSQSGDH